MAYAGRVERGLCLATALAVTLGTSSARGDTLACSRAYEQGQRLRSEAQLIRARAELVTCAQDACPSRLRKECIAWLAEVAESIPTLAIHVRGADGCDRPNATTWIDGVLVERGAEGKPLEVDPGPHTVRAEVDGAIVEQTVVVPSFDRGRIVRISVGSNVGTCGGIAPPRAVPTTPEPPREGARRVPALTYVFGGIGVLGLGVGAGFGISGWSQKATLDECKGACDDASIDAMRRTFVASDVALGIGVLALSLGTVFYLAR